MTNLEKIRQSLAEMDESDIAERMCYHFDCARCPGAKYCTRTDGHANGLKVWLKEEAENDY